MTTAAPTPAEWVDAFLAMKRERQLLVAAAVHTSVEQASACYRNHSRLGSAEARAELDADERERCLRSFEAMADLVDVVIANEDDVEQRREALRLFKVTTSALAEYLSPETAVPTAELGGQS